MRIEVTAVDISRGHPEDDCRCPVSLAIRRATGLAVSVSVGQAVIDYATPWQTEVWLPEEAGGFVEDFDLGKRVRPFAFDLDFDAAEHERGKLESIRKNPDQ